MNYKKYLINDYWDYVPPKLNEIYYITKFDDGLNNYTIYPNKWIIFGEWKGKISLFNQINPKIIIRSISAWKVQKHIDFFQLPLSDNDEP